MNGLSPETQFHTWDGWRQVVQYKLDDAQNPDAAVPTKQFVWGAGIDELIVYRCTTGGVWGSFFLISSGQDTPRMLVDGSGAIVEYYEYDAYGKASVYVGSSGTALEGSSVGMPFLWKGMRRDAETGLLYMRNRHYSVALGRFLSQDPIGPWGDVVNWGNDYTYCGNSPLVYGDALGLQSNLIPGYSGPPSLDEQMRYDAQQAAKRLNEHELPEELRITNEPIGPNSPPSSGPSAEDAAFLVGGFVKIIGGVVSFLGGIPGNGLGTADSPLPEYWRECTSCRSRLRKGQLCMTPECVARRIKKAVRDKIRDDYPGFFGSNPKGLGAADIDVTHKSGGLTGEKHGGLPVVQADYYEITVNVPDLGISTPEPVRLGGEKYALCKRPVDPPGNRLRRRHDPAA